MSRTSRMEHFLQVFRPKKPRNLKIKEINQMLRRQFRRDMKAQGLLEDEPLTVWSYSGGTVEARTRSEARSLIKAQLGVERLPPGFIIQKHAD